METASIEGTVVKLSDGAPLKTAIVELLNQDDPHHTVITAVTSFDGRFQVKGLAPGRYHLLEERTGFVRQEYGQRRPRDPGSLLTLAAGQELRDLLFRMIPSAVIAGHVFNEDGEPVALAEISALREVYSEGARKLRPEAMGSTNDLGEFRLFELNPGRYFLRVMYRLGGRGRLAESVHLLAADNSAVGYISEYYPGVTELSKATTVAVKAGEEIRSVDISLRPVSVFSIRGKVNNTVAREPEIGVDLELVPRGNQFFFNGFEARHTFPRSKDGSFEFSGISPGAYTLSVRWSSQGKSHGASQELDVGNADIEGVNMTIAAGMTIIGSVIWEGQPSIARDALNVYATPADANSGRFGSEEAKVAPDGTFSLSNIAEGTYRLNIYGESADSYLKAVRYGTNSATESGFKVQRASDAALEVTISSRGGRVTGTVADTDGLPAAGVWVALVPDKANQSQNRLRLFKEKITDQYGRFDLRGIAPGDYELFSWNEVEQGAWEDPNFLKPFEEKGEKVSVQEGDAKSVNLVAIKTASTEQPKP